MTDSEINILPTAKQFQDGVIHQSITNI